MLRIDSRTAEAVSAYVAGWAVSRGTPRPTPAEFGWHVATGQPHESERYVPVRGTAGDIQALATALRTPLACLKFAGSYDDWRPLFGTEWIDNPAGWFMTAGLSNQASTARSVGTVRVDQRGDLICVTIRSDGEVVATGRLGMAGDWCVPDRIRTGERHRRKGLGRIVMHALLNRAHAAGARHAVLDASADGRALYTAMGWTLMSPQFGLTRNDSTTSADRP